MKRHIHGTAMIRIRDSHTGIIDRPFIHRIVEINIIMRKWRELCTLRRDLTCQVVSVPRRFEDVDLRRTAALCD